MTVKDHYQDVIDQIINENGWEPLTSAPTPIVTAEAGFKEVLLHTDWYVHRGDSQAHYRYRRYRELLDYINASSDSRVANVDIGSGAGVFGWPFLDWAAARGLPFNQVGLYGYDHSVQMRTLAQLIRSRLMQYIDDYPPLRYACEVPELLPQLTNNHVEGMDYVITLGHALAQTYEYTAKDIERYSEIIAHVCGLIAAGSPCYLFAADARGATLTLQSGWDLLLSQLDSAGIACEQRAVPQSPQNINDNSRAKVAVLRRR